MFSRFHVFEILAFEISYFEILCFRDFCFRDFIFEIFAFEILAFEIWSAIHTGFAFALKTLVDGIVGFEYAL